jgi:hypothetical protein
VLTIALLLVLAPGPGPTPLTAAEAAITYRHLDGAQPHLVAAAWQAVSGAIAMAVAGAAALLLAPTQALLAHLAWHPISALQILALLALVLGWRCAAHATPPA